MMPPVLRPRSFAGLAVGWGWSTAGKLDAQRTPGIGGPLVVAARRIVDPDRVCAAATPGIGRDRRQEASCGQAEKAGPEGKKGNREAHGQGRKEASLGVCRGQKEKIPSGIWPIERGDD